MDKYIDFREFVDVDKLNFIASEIRNGKIVVFPTETVYGIGTNGLNEASVQKLYEIRKRPITKPISLLVSDINMAQKYAKSISDIEYKIMNAFFPGPLTILLKKADIVPNITTANSDFVGIRMPDSDIARELVSYAGVPIATPSANIAGQPSGTNISSIMADFKDTADYFIDGGESRLGQASTVVKVENGIPIILREGSISLEQIKRSI